MLRVGRNDPCPCGGRSSTCVTVQSSSELSSLLKEMEVIAERDRRAGRPAYDFTRMWAALGLERPG